MKKILALVVAAMLLLSCAAFAEEYVHTYDYPERITDEEKTLDVMWWIGDAYNIDTTNLWFNDHLEEITGVHVNIQAVSETEFANQLNLMYASGSYPDIVIDSGSKVNVEMYGVAQNVFLPLDDIIEEYMPNYAAILATSETAHLGMIASDGHLYSVGKIADANAPSSKQFLFLNQEWLDELSLDLPETTDELLEIMRAFKEAHPDNYVFEARFGEMLYNFSEFWGFQEAQDTWFSITNEGEVVFNATLPQYREFVEYLATMYEEGIMDPDCMTMDHSTRLVKLADADAGCILIWRLRSYGCDQLIGKMTFADGIHAEGYEYLADFAMPLASNCAFITSGCEDIELAATWLDFLLNKQVLFESFYGPEGLLWNWNEAGQCVLGADGDRGSTDYAYNVNGVYYLPGEYYGSTFLQPDYRLERTGYCNAVAAARQVYPNAYVNALNKPTIDETTEIAKILPGITSLMNENLANFIMNGVTDEAWDAFQQNLINAGIERYVEIYQRVFDEYMG